MKSRCEHNAFVTVDGRPEPSEEALRGERTD